MLRLVCTAPVIPWRAGLINLLLQAESCSVSLEQHRAVRRVMNLATNLKTYYFSPLKGLWELICCVWLHNSKYWLAGHGWKKPFFVLCSAGGGIILPGKHLGICQEVKSAARTLLLWCLWIHKGRTGHRSGTCPGEDTGCWRCSLEPCHAPLTWLWVMHTAASRSLWNHWEL